MKNPSMKKKLKKHELSPPKNSNVKLPKINVSFSDKILTKLNREAYGRKVPNLSHMKMNTKSIYEINKDKTTFNYEFEDKIRKEIKEFRKIRELQSKCNKENEFKSKEERNSNRSIKKTKRQKTQQDKSKTRKQSIKLSSEDSSLFNQIQNFLMEPHITDKNLSERKIKKKIKEKMAEYKQKYSESIPLKRNTVTITDNMWKKLQLNKYKFAIDASEFLFQADRITKLTENNENSLKDYVSVMFEKNELEDFRKQLPKVSKKKI